MQHADCSDWLSVTIKHRYNKWPEESVCDSKSDQETQDNFILNGRIKQNLDNNGDQGEYEQWEKPKSSDSISIFTGL